MWNAERMEARDALPAVPNGFKEGDDGFQLCLWRSEDYNAEAKL
jgi:hypothetical protein